MTSPVTEGPVDAELSAGALAYVSRGRSRFPKEDPDAVRAIAAQRSPEALLAAVEALLAEMDAIPVDWATLGLQDASHRVRDVMRERHPELSAEAVSALVWYFSYVNNR